MTRIDLTGKKIGKLSVVRCVGSDKSGRSMFECNCECGRVVTVRGSNLKSGNSTQCKPCASTISATKHGECYSDEYKIWNRMWSRCTNLKLQHAHRYVKRGISVCARWETFENFLADMGRRPSKKHSIDRINNDGNYEPGNCRWADKLTQARNTFKSTCKYTYVEMFKDEQNWIRVKLRRPDGKLVIVSHAEFRKRSKAGRVIEKSDKEAAQ